MQIAYQKLGRRQRSELLLNPECRRKPAKEDFRQYSTEG